MGCLVHGSSFYPKKKNVYTGIKTFLFGGCFWCFFCKNHRFYGQSSRSQYIVLVSQYKWLNHSTWQFQWSQRPIFQALLHIIKKIIPGSPFGDGVDKRGAKVFVWKGDLLKPQDSTDIFLGYPRCVEEKTWYFLSFTYKPKALPKRSRQCSKIPPS